MSAPRWALALLRRLAPPDRVEDVLGDLEEMHRRRVERRGAVRAAILTGLEALDMALALLRSRRAERADRASAVATRRKRAPTIGISWLDVKLGLRILAKYPGLSLVGGLGIAVAVAIGAVIFSAAAIMHTPLPVDEADRVVAVELWDREWNNQERRILHDFASWRGRLRSIRDLGAWDGLERNLIVDGAAGAPVRVAAITASAFRVTGAPAHLGRPLLDADEREGAEPVVVLGHDVWRNRFDADPGVVGREVRIGRSVHTVVGVMPEAFAFPIRHDVWIPFQFDAADYERREGPGIRVFGRLAPGATLDDARAELNTWAASAAADFPETHARLTPRVMPYTLQLYDDMEGWELPFLSMLVVLLLVVVCVNVAILVYARTATRTGEIAVRSALGASRRRVVTQLFVEALVLSALASLLGLVIAGVAFDRIGAFVERLDMVPYWIEFRLPPGAVFYVLALAVIGALIVGVAPALKATGRRVQARLQRLSAGTPGLRLGGTWTALIVAQVAVTVATLPAAVAFGRMALEYGGADPGFPAEEFLTARLLLDREIPASGETEVQQREFESRYRELQTELASRLRAEPGVSDVILSMGVPGVEPTVWVEVEGVPMPSGNASGDAVRSGTAGHRVGIGRVDVRFFDAFDIPLHAGRVFEPADTGAAGTAVVVNLSFVRQILGGGNALGRRLRYVGRGGDVSGRNVDMERWFEIVGVVDDFPPNTLDPGLARAKVYHAQAPGEVYGAMLVTRVEGVEPSALARRLRGIGASIDPGLRFGGIQTLDEALRQEQAGWRIGGWGLGLLTLSVLLLAAAGIYAMMSFTVTQRRREIGIRSALGAEPRRVLASVFARAFRQLAIGVGAGVVGAALLDQGTGGQFTGGEGAILLAAVAAFMMGVGLAAALGPARRGLAIQPTEALKEL